MAALSKAAGGVRADAFGSLDLSGKVVLSAGALLAVYLVLVPLAMLLATAFRGPAEFLPFETGAGWTLANLRELYSDPVLYARVVPDTVVFALGASVLAFAIGFALAWLVERTDLPAREFWFALILLPFLVPTPVLGIAWIFLLGPHSGWVNVALRTLFGSDATSGPINIFSMPGLIVCQALAAVPFVFLLLSAALRSMNPALEEASGTAGASPVTTFVRVTLPVLLPGLLAPLILVLLITLEQFDLPLIIGLPARINVFSYRIVWELNPQGGLPNYGGAAAVALPFLALGIALLAVYNRLIRRAERFVTVTGKSWRQRRLRLGRWRAPAFAFVGLYIALAAVLPALVLLWTSFFNYHLPSPAALAKFSPDAYRALVADSRFWLGLGNTLIVAGGSALIVTFVGALLAWIVVRTRFAGRAVLDFISFLSVGIPSVIAALAVMLVFLTLPIGLYGTVAILVLAYSYRLSVSTRLARAGLMQIHRELEEASAASGARWLTSQRRILLPLLAPSLLAGFILLFITGVREFTIPLVLYGQGNIVLSVLLWQLFQGGQGAMAAALSSIIIALVLPIVFLARRHLAPGGSGQ